MSASYLNPTSVTFWSGAVSVVAGLVLLFDPPGWGPIVQAIRGVTTLDSGELILGGLAIIAGRRKLEDLGNGVRGSPPQIK